jgi:drug/metabolite transporter (DMT)-like permease
MIIRALMIISAFFWAGAFIAGKIAVSEIDPITLTFIRFAVASIVMFIFIKIRKISIKPDWIILKRAIILSVVGMIGYHLLFYKALIYTKSINASVIGAMNPMITYLLSLFLYNSKLDLKKMSFVAFAFILTILTLTNWKINLIISGGINVGDLLMLLAVVLWVSYSFIYKKFAKGYNQLELSLYIFFFTSILLLPFSDFIILNNFINMKYSTDILISSIYMGIFPTVIGYVVQQESIVKIGPVNTSIFINLVPIFTLILSYLVLGDTIGILKITSSLLAVFTIYLFSRYSIKLEKQS